jgi:hypothetical protein
MPGIAVRRVAVAGMGLAAVGMEYEKSDEAAFQAQFGALLGRLQRQPWTATNAALRQSSVALHTSG